MFVIPLMFMELTKTTIIQHYLNKAKQYKVQKEAI